MNAWAAASLVCLAPLVVIAAPDAGEGRKLVHDHKCEACHEGKVQGPEGTIYLRKNRKVASWAKLNSQVALCNSGLGLGLFPEDEENIAAFLNEAYYKFRAK